MILPGYNSTGGATLLCHAGDAPRHCPDPGGRKLIDPTFLYTPLYQCEALEPGLGCAVSIKLETANPVRSFGTELVTSLLADSGSRAVVCAAVGNLGRALAWSGRRRRLDVTVVASRFASATKLDRIRSLGASLELVDGDFDTARERAADIARHDGIRLVEDSLDIETCEGTATIGLERRLPWTWRQASPCWAPRRRKRRA